MLGVLDTKGYELDNRVYFRGGVLPLYKHDNSSKNVCKKVQEK